MENLIVIGPDNIVRGVIARVDLPARQVHLANNKAQQTTEYESAPGAGDVTFETVTDPDQAAFELRELNAGYGWDPVNKRGIIDQSTIDNRARADADTDSKNDARAVLSELRAIANGTYPDPPAKAVRVLARAVRFLVVRALRD